MPDKNPKNNKKLKQSAVVKHEEVKDRKHESPTEKDTQNKKGAVKSPFAK